MKLFINAGVPSDVDPTIDYPKKLVLGSILKPSVSNEIGPPFCENGGRMGFMAARRAWCRRYLITRTRYIDGICLSASMVLLSRCSSVSNMV